ncbi:MAG: asparagine synthase (glutamine-hydrolyzing) [Alteromonadaceae bacterium]|nr:asparagine synthase (glutamine-hydrolyzing) [Alteromonadaceae bacterium]
MCGISGFYNVEHSKKVAISELNNMLNTIIHRGPDDSGIWHQQGLTLGHRRLAIQDLSQAGHQPMSCQADRYTLVFNGEIYNFEELRAELIGVKWRGHSDTEVMLAAFNRWGIKKSLTKFNGMFAFAVWDNVEQKLILARDRFGEKPLYYLYDGRQFVFASELRAIEALSSVKLSINRGALQRQLECSYIPAPLSIYNEVNKLAPGTYITFRPDKGIKLETYWALAEMVSAAKSNMIIDEREAVYQLEAALKKAVKLRMASDVPLGAFLSGGVDSSLVVALMQAQSSKPINTFSIGFDVPGYNEAEYAKEVADYLGTNHHEQYLTPQQALDIVPKIGGMFDEPFSDASQIPTYLVSAMAKEKVTVCLSGDGGDELFSGYKRYIATPDIWNKISKFPCRSVFSRLISKTPVSVLEKLFFFLKPFTVKYGRAGVLGPKVKTFGHWIKAQSIDELYILSMMHWKNASEVVIGGQLQSIWSPQGDSIENVVEKMMYQDSIAYLPGDILTKVDRTGMAVSLEGRIPLLDHNVAELAWRLPINMKQRGDCGKWALKQVLYKYLPQKMMERPKMGFGVPIHLWLKKELKDWAGDLLSHQRLKEQGLFNPDFVANSFAKHISGEENNSAALWDVLMTQSWLEADKRRLTRLV